LVGRGIRLLVPGLSVLHLPPKRITFTSIHSVRGEQVRAESTVRFAALSDRGRRERNEDAFFAGVVGGCHIFAVADGLGGHECGDVASRIAITTLEETARWALASTDPSSLLETAYHRTNAAIDSYNKNFHVNAGTTLSAAILDASGNCWIGTVGDSRTHIITSSSIWHTTDQSYVQGLIDAGLLSPAEALRHPKKNILTQALGLGMQVRVDIVLKTIHGAALVLSSDGLHDYLPEDRIQEIAAAHEPGEACRMLVAGALEEHSTDNITVVVARI
jgi:PPM family protein phosphatase